MTRQGDEWVFSEGGAPYLAEHRPFEGDDAPSRTSGPSSAT